MTTPTAGRDPRPASGAQFELARGGARAQVGQVAAVLRAFSVDGVHYTETWDDAELPPMACGISLAPWPNRVADARWTHEGAVQKLDVTDLEYGHAIHGLLRNTAYQPVHVDDAAVTLAASIYPQHGYPFLLDVEITYELDDTGLQVTHLVRNVGARPAPFGAGAHPYLRVGTHPVEDLVVTVSGTRYARTDERMVPVAVEPVDGTPMDLRAGARLGDVEIDVALTGFDVENGRVEHRLRAPDGNGVALWADEVFGWAQVFAPSIFPGPGKPNQRKAVAIEPMTCGVNAFNTGDDLITLGPGEQWSASWGIRPLAMFVG